MAENELGPPNESTLIPFVVLEWELTLFFKDIFESGREKCR